MFVLQCVVWDGFGCIKYSGLVSIESVLFLCVCSF